MEQPAGSSEVTPHCSAWLYPSTRNSVVLASFKLHSRNSVSLSVLLPTIILGQKNKDIALLYLMFTYIQSTEPPGWCLPCTVWGPCRGCRPPGTGSIWPGWPTWCGAWSAEGSGGAGCSCTWDVAKIINQGYDTNK